MGPREQHARRLRSQWLSGPRAHDVVDVVTHLLAVQAQDLRGARLSVRARSTGLVAGDVDAAFDDGRLVVSWLQRGTLHLVASEDFWWLHDLLAARQETGNERRLAQEGVDAAAAARGVRLLADAVADGPRTRAELRDLLSRAGVRTEGQAFVHLLAAASRQGLLVRGPMVDGEHAFVSPASWIGPRPDPLDVDVAVRRLGERYLTAHGPAGPRDLARWAGLPLGLATAALDGLDGGVAGGAPAIPPPRLLGPFDASLLGWDGRAEIVGDHVGIITSNGLFRPIVLVDGRAVATWRIAGSRVRSIDWLDPVGDEVRRAVDAEVADVERFLSAPA
jgi:DNA glycosylase AlkZ-like